MTLLRTSLITTTALSLSLGAAWADDNEAYLDQTGTGNTALITQPGMDNEVGLSGDPALQDGNLNTLTITQVGNGNDVGTEGTGFRQKGNGLTGTHSDNGFSVAKKNIATISQTSNGNVIGQVDQNRAGGSSKGANTLTVTQEEGDGNRINTINQSIGTGKRGQIATVLQSGANNFINLLSQTGGDLINSIDATFDGDDNGQASLAAYAAASGATSSDIIQDGHGMILDLDITGNNNAFGTFQKGRDNTVSPLVVIGDNNSLGVYQNGRDNDIMVSAINGFGNDIGLRQLGWGNSMNFDMITGGNDNMVLIDQLSASDSGGGNTADVDVDGNGNDLQLFQVSALGETNGAVIDVDGDENVAEVRQTGNNTFNMKIDGNKNNSAGLGGFAPLSDAGSLGLTAGLFTQDGQNNFADIDVLSSDNVFATKQDNTSGGSVGNSIIAMVSGGDGNQFAISQMGDANTANLSQTGSSNNAGITQ